MIKNILLLLTLTCSLTSLSQATIWVSNFEINENNPCKSKFYNANRIFVKQTADSLLLYDVGKEEFTNRFKNGLAYKIKNDSLLIKPLRDREFEGSIKNDTLQLKLKVGLTNYFAPLQKPKLSFAKIEKLFYSRSFEIILKELYIKPGYKSPKSKIIKFSKKQDRDQSVMRARILEFDGYYFFQMKEGREKLFPILEYSRDRIVLFAPNESNNIATLKVVPE